MSFYGKEYVLDRTENYEAFVNSLKDLSEEGKQKLLALKPSVKIVKNGDEYTLSTIYAPGRTSDLTFKSGVEFDEKILDHTAKTTITVDGNTVIQVQKFGDKGTFTYKREFSDDTLVTTLTSSSWDGVAKRIFKAL